MWYAVYMEHGKLSSYTGKNCRCDECKAVAMAYFKKKSEERKAKGLAPGAKQHGTKNGYTNYGCRCDECKAAAHRIESRLRHNGFWYQVWIEEEQSWFEVGARVT